MALAWVIVVIWGANFSLQKYAFAAMTPAGFIFARYLIMPVCALAMLLHHGGGRLPALSRDDFWALARLAFIGHVVHVGMTTYGIHWSTAFSSSVLMACGPVFTLLILRIMRVETLTRMQVAGVALACVGVLVFLSDKLLAGGWRATGGDLFLLVSTSFFSYYTVRSKVLIMRLGTVPVICWSTLIASAPMVLATLPAAVSLDWAAMPAVLWPTVFWMVVVSAFLGWVAWGWINATLGVARVAPMMYLMPPVAGLVAWLVTDERFTAAKLLGAAVTLSGVALAQFGSTPDRPERESPGLVE